MTASGGAASVHLLPIADLKRGAVVGHHVLDAGPGSPGATSTPDPAVAAAEHIHAFARIRPELPPRTFAVLDLPVALLDTLDVYLAFEALGELTGVVIGLADAHDTSPGAAAALAASLVDLRSRGALVAIGDATGTPTFDELLAVRPDMVRVGHPLVQGIADDDARLGLVATLGAAAEQLDAWLIATDVESARDLDALARLGVPLAQGGAVGDGAERPSELRPDIALHLRSVAASRRTDDTVVALLDPAARRHRGRSGPPPCTDDSVEWVAVLDDTDVPVALVLCAHGPRTVPVTLRVGVTARPDGVLRRAMNRRRETRFDPAVVVDDTGRFLGLVRIERLVEHVSAPTGLFADAGRAHRARGWGRGGTLEERPPDIGPSTSEG